jgi:YrbI family 3-deoxy-D-manno-octulosonate 8-phosphate phosphatase
MKAFITDLDGTLTDGCHYLIRGNNPGFGYVDSYAKKFNTRDFHGMQLLHEAGILIVLVSSAHSSLGEVEFYRSAPYAKVFTGVKDKLALVEQKIVNEEGVDWQDIAFIGDDVNDLSLLKRVGMAACPADAEDEVRAAVQENPNGYLMDRKGGAACVREFANMILKYKRSV